eukprot:TRINITY_DN691_c1_g1_i3.p3 TRINITY_DN691_c1_g1~~TRINITY_DN691_c1_g1_i3.p3  ORF type:complete len:100 (+),score=4.79 TRINITY_DN691_c1_g1_i3:70-369(+)
MSSDKEGENPSRRKSKGSCARSIRAGLAGPQGEAERRSRWEPGQYSWACQELTDGGRCSDLSDCPGVEAVPGNSPSFRPYPKPTQVDWQSIPRRLRERC